MEQYLEFIRDRETNTETLLTLATSLTQTSSNILVANPEDVIIDELYVFLQELQTVLLCGLTCGEEAIKILVCSLFFLCM